MLIYTNGSESQEVSQLKARIKELEQENSALNSRLDVMTTLYNKELAENKELHSTIDTLNATIVDYKDRLNYFYEFQYRLKVHLKDCHHLGNFTAKDVRSKRWRYGITGTVEGFLGFLPTDTGLANRQYFDVVQDHESVRINTYTWEQSSDTNVHKALWGDFLNITWADELKYMHNRSYPQLDFPAALGYHYDPDPPDPQYHMSGLSMELCYFRTDSVFTPSYGRQNKLLETILKNYVRRVMPFVKDIQQFLDKAL